MKKFFGVLVGVLFAMTMTGQAGAASRGDLLTDKQRAQGLQGDLGPYKQIFPYIPIDAKRVPERQGVCDKKFNEGHFYKYPTIPRAEILLRVK